LGGLATDVHQEDEGPLRRDFVVDAEWVE
jgi:hypothetical protein